MKSHKLVSEVIERKKVHVHECDFCGEDLTILKASTQLESDLNELYDFDQCGYGPSVETTIQIEMSNGYPECGGSKTISIDACPKCFKTKILSLVKNHNIEETEY